MKSGGSLEHSIRNGSPFINMTINTIPHIEAYISILRVFAHQRHSIHCFLGLPMDVLPTVLCFHIFYSLGSKYWVVTFDKKLIK